MQVLSLFGVIFSVIVFIVLIYKGIHILISSILASLVAILFSGLPLFETITSPFIPGLTGVFGSYFLIFTLSALLGKLVTDSGIARSLAMALANIARKSDKHKKLLGALSIAVLNAILTFAGISLFVLIFTIVAIGKDLFEELDIPWHLYGLATIGSATFTVSMLPGTPAIQNLIPMKYLGTTPMAAPTIGIASAILMIVLCLIYSKIEVDKTIKAGEGFLPTGALIKESQTAVIDQELSPIWMCLIPLATTFIVMNVLKQAPPIALLAAVIVTIVLFWNKLTNLKATINNGFTAAINPLLVLSAASAYGKVVAISPGFKLFTDSLFGLPLPSIMIIIISVLVPTVVTGSSSAALNISFDAFIDQYLATGLNPQVIHRVATMTSNMSLMPHCAGVVNALAIVKLTHKQIYKHYFVIGILLMFVTVVFAATLAVFGVV
jgi:H+/gluconate symporter-like permease